ncbi:DNA polymerase III subunit gamma/tau [Microbacterium sp. ET2]|uniref:DNA polymerase III subunit gamma/tau n=1 Tax=Microbacterium albipurpureum TaxID=3050384 RepID=UPI00259D13AB|nr:DNA polymerase III subunit gamma/tau [Microbacterium sp. ET2 (Ac-2212)]WJL95816.1 DNA polymerase III subunit gamma/tau [Microbacterium sp. ET2 (Ac-2212)]
MTSRDEDAFRWEGDDPAPVDPPSAAEGAPPTLPPGYRAVGKGSHESPPTEEAASESDVETGADTASGDETAELDAPGGMGNASLIALGILGGVYLLFSIGWLIGGLRVHGVASFLVSGDGIAPPVWTTGNAAAVGLAVAAPALWFTAVYTLTRRSAAWLRWVLLGAGVVLLVPWPFIVVGAFGS